MSNPFPMIEPKSLQEQFEQLELAYLMAAEQSQLKGGFLGRVSHELRSPLNGMIGMHQLILADLCDSPEEERDFIQQANDSALKLITVLDHVIMTARLEHGTSQPNLQPIALSQVLYNVHTVTHLQAKNRTIRLHIPIPDSTLEVLADSTRLQQVLVSLIDTTIAHLQDGEITLSIQPDSANRAVHLWLDQPLPIQVWNAHPGSSTQDSAAPANEVPLLKKSAIAELMNAPFPSAQFVLQVAQKLMRSMNGDVMINSATLPAKPPRIQITLPLS
jgi:signal transduction histidine kinase